MRIEKTPDHFIQHMSIIIMSLIIRTYAPGSEEPGKTLKDWKFHYYVKSFFRE